MARHCAARVWRISSWGAVSDLVLRYIARSVSTDSYSKYITILFFSNSDLSLSSVRYADKVVALPIIPYS